MDIAIQHTKTIMIESLNTLFVKWWGVTPLLALTWFGDKLVLFITPVQVEGWVKLAITFVIGVIAIWYTLRKKRQSERHDEEKHRQELAQDKMNGWIEQFEKARHLNVIDDTVTLADFIKQIEKIEAENASQNTL